MKALRVQGGNRLQGEVTIQGSKNGTLPVLAATILVPGVSVIENCPMISDVEHMCRLLGSLGAKVQRQENRILVDATVLTSCSLPREYVTRMRSSVMLMGAMLGRLKEADLDYPGGCVIGERPIDMHTESLQRLGVSYSYRQEGLHARTEGLKGARLKLPFPSVGATENLILAAVLAEGVTEIYNPALEPEICMLCDFLTGAGAKIRGAGSGCIRIQGVKSLKESTFCMPADRIVAGTYLFGICGAGGEGFLRHAPAEQMEAVLRAAERMGAKILQDEQGLRVLRKRSLMPLPFLCTEVYPGFPTDLQSPLLAALLQAGGRSTIWETIFEDRFKIVPQLQKMGARIETDGKEAVLTGGRPLCGAKLEAEELRGGAALVLAALCAEGKSRITGVSFIQRGYEDIGRDLRCLGADLIEE